MTEAIYRGFADAGFARQGRNAGVHRRLRRSQNLPGDFLFRIAERGELRLNFFQHIHKPMTIITFTNFNYPCRQSRLTETISCQHLPGATADKSIALFFGIL